MIRRVRECAGGVDLIGDEKGVDSSILLPAMD